jgi:hypothetical protein
LCAKHSQFEYALSNGLATRGESAPSLPVFPGSGRDLVRSPATVMLTIAYGYRPAVILHVCSPLLQWLPHSAASASFTDRCFCATGRTRSLARDVLQPTWCLGAFIMHSDRASAAAAPEEASDEVNEEALATVMRVVPLGAGVLAGTAVACW